MSSGTSDGQAAAATCPPVQKSLIISDYRTLLKDIIDNPEKFGDLDEDLIKVIEVRANRLNRIAMIRAALCRSPTKEQKETIKMVSAGYDLTVRSAFAPSLPSGVPKIMKTEVARAQKNPQKKIRSDAWVKADRELKHTIELIKAESTKVGHPLSHDHELIKLRDQALLAKKSSK